MNSLVRDGDSPPTGTGLAVRMKNEDHLIDMRIDFLHRRVSGRETAVTLHCAMFRWGGIGGIDQSKKNALSSLGAKHAFQYPTVPGKNSSRIIPIEPGQPKRRAIDSLQLQQRR